MKGNGLYVVRPSKQDAKYAPCVLSASLCFRRLSSSRYKTQYDRFAWDEDFGAIKRIDFTSCERNSAGDVDDKYYSKYYFFPEVRGPWKRGV